MSKLSKIKQFFVLAVVLLSCSCGDKIEKQEKINIFVTIPPYANFVKQIVGNIANVNMLIPPGVNAHSFELNPRIIKNVTNADIYFSIGSVFNFENLVLSKLKLDKSNIIDCSKNIKLINNNPHYWLSIENAKIISINISETLSRKYPAHKNYFKKNEHKFINKLDSIDLSIRTALNQKTNKTLLVYHPAWTYFANEFGMEQISIEHDGKEPKAKELKNIIQMAKDKGVKCIFFDPHFDESSVETIARSLGLKIESLDPLPLNYLENLKEIRDKLNRHLE